MRIVRVDTLRLAEQPNVLYVEVHTDAGLVGLGETYFGARAVEAWIHESAGPALLGEDALDVKGLSERLVGYLGYSGTGAESRGRSAVDIALWDLLGKASEQPLWRLLGGGEPRPIPVYNTCAGPAYARAGNQRVVNWGLPDAAADRYDDLAAFLTRADELALDLRDEGIGAMKIWPFDMYAEASGGRRISARELDAATEPLRRIRDAVGLDVDVMVELHGLWALAPAREIVAALEPFQPRWIEDPVRSDDLAGLADLSLRSNAPIAAGETVAGARAFAGLLDAAPLGVCILDLSWCGGITEAARIAADAARRGIAVAAHDCTGPVVLAASTHFTSAAPNADIQETVRAFVHGWYADVAGPPPVITNGSILPPPGPGHGITLRQDLAARLEVSRQSSERPGS